MTSSLGFFINSFVTIFSVLDPFGAAVILLAMTAGSSARGMDEFAIRSVKTAALALAAFTVAGGMIFSFFGISINALLVAGGLILVKISFKMLEGAPLASGGYETAANETTASDDNAIIPMAVPILAGPAAITTVTVFASRAEGVADWVALIAALTLALFLTSVILRNSGKMAELLGGTGLRILTRLMGLILIAMGVEFALSGLKGYFG
ncbi:MAG: NAAT family transporter [Nitrospinae bacterium]|nr:NAAT family transporter [Nitrospinota bacterium]